jgi:hypothetical protein
MYPGEPQEKSLLAGLDAHFRHASSIKEDSRIASNVFGNPETTPMSELVGHPNTTTAHIPDTGRNTALLETKIFCWMDC